MVQVHVNLGPEVKALVDGAMFWGGAVSASIVLIVVYLLFGREKPV